MTNEQKEKLEEVASEFFYYVINARVIKKHFDALQLKECIASPYLNFRDALFHFKKMYEAARDEDSDGFIKQNACVQEHMNRGLKDFAIHICSHFYIRKIHDMLMVSEMMKADVNELRHIYHRLKNFVVATRIEGQTFKHLSENADTWLSEFVDIIENYNSLVKPDMAKFYSLVDQHLYH